MWTLRLRLVTARSCATAFSMRGSSGVNTLVSCRSAALTSGSFASRSEAARIRLTLGEFSSQRKTHAMHTHRVMPTHTQGGAYTQNKKVEGGRAHMSRWTASKGVMH